MKVWDEDSLFDTSFSGNEKRKRASRGVVLMEMFKSNLTRDVLYGLL